MTWTGKNVPGSHNILLCMNVHTNFIHGEYLRTPGILNYQGCPPQNYNIELNRMMRKLKQSLAGIVKEYEESGIKTKSERRFCLLLTWKCILNNEMWLTECHCSNLRPIVGVAETR